MIQLLIGQGSYVCLIRHWYVDVNGQPCMLFSTMVIHNFLTNKDVVEKFHYATSKNGAIFYCNAIDYTKKLPLIAFSISSVIGS